MDTMNTIIPRRITVCKNGFATGVMVIIDNDQIDSIITKIVHTLNELSDFTNYLNNDGELKIFYLYSINGDLIISSDAIRDNDRLILKCEGDLFRTPIQRTSLEYPGDWVNLNVGGIRYTTTRMTLTLREPDSMIARMFCEDSTWQHRKDPIDNSILIDRSGKYFAPILNYLRHGVLVMENGISVSGLYEEAKFFGIASLIENLQSKLKDELNQNNSDAPLKRREFILKLLATPSNSELRCQGLNFDGADLTRLDLRFLNLKYATFRGANLSYCNLAYCTLERADLRGACLDHAQFRGAKMLRVCLENASMKECNFEDPAGSHANLEGANMKHSNLEGSRMAGINLRVATLKKANLQNCDLRGAILAGADLEDCDLNGCDLQDANLRGANFQGASFELMVNPVHMSQTV